MCRLILDDGRNELQRNRIENNSDDKAKLRCCCVMEQRSEIEEMLKNQIQEMSKNGRQFSLIVSPNMQEIIIPDMEQSVPMEDRQELFDKHFPQDGVTNLESFVAKCMDVNERFGIMMEKRKWHIEYEEMVDMSLGGDMVTRHLVASLHGGYKVFDATADSSPHHCDQIPFLSQCGRLGAILAYDYLFPELRKKVEVYVMIRSDRVPSFATYERIPTDMYQLVYQTCIEAHLLSKYEVK